MKVELRKERIMNVYPQFVVCADCEAVFSTIILKRVHGKTTTHCPNCGSENIHSSYS